MAKGKKHNKPGWKSLQEIYAAELAKFNSPKPALRAVRDRFLRQPYRYFDVNGVRHKNDLSNDFIWEAEFRIDESSAVWSGGAVLPKKVLTRNASAFTEMDEYIADQNPGYGEIAFSGKQPEPEWRRWRRDPRNPQTEVSFEEVVHGWEAYAIELLEAPAVAASVPPPEPPKTKKKTKKATLFAEIERCKLAGEKLPPSRAAQARYFAGRTGIDSRTIENLLPRGGL